MSARAAYAVVVAGVALACRELLLGRVPYFRDVTYLFAPLRALVTQAWHTGHPPLWNPHVWMGVPLWGDPQAAVLYPATLLFVLLPAPLAWNLHVIAHGLLACLATLGFLRARGAGVVGATAGALTYGIGGVMLSAGASLPNVHAAAAWLPAVAWAAQRTARAGAGRDTVRPCLVLGLVVGVQVLAGSPAVSLLSLVAAVASVGTAPGARARHRWRSGLVSLALAVLLGAGVAAAQVLPALGWLGESARTHLTLEEAGSYSWHPLRAFEWIAPGVWGSIPAGTWWGGFLVRPPAGPPVPLFPAVYAGMLPWMLLGIAWRRPHAVRGFATLFGAVSLVWALGEHLPTYAWAAQVLPIEGLRYPEKAMVGVAFALACLVAQGCDALHASRPSRRTWVPSAVLGAAGLALVGLGASETGAAGLARVLHDLVRSHATLLPIPDVGPSLARAGVHLLGLTLAAAACWTLARRYRRLRAWPVLFVLIDLAATSGGALWTTEAGILTRPPRVAAVLAGNASGADLALYEPGVRPPGRFRGTSGIEALMHWSREVGLANTGAPYGVRYADGYGPANRWDVAQIPLRAWPALGLAWIVRPPASPASAHLAPEVVWRDPQLGVEVAAVRAARPRAYWTANVRTAATSAEAWARLGSDRPAERDATYLEAPAARETAIALRPETSAYEGPAWIPVRVTTTTTPARLRLEVEAPADGIVVLNDAYDPDWRATMDGRPAPILRANGVARAVRVPGGRHVVTMRYHPTRVTAGLAITAATLLGMAGVAGWDRRARRRAPGGSG